MNKQKSRDGEATKKTVLDAAEKLFAEKGFAGTSIRNISEACGISDGLILHHFKTKDALYQAVREQLADHYRAALSENLTYSSDMPRMMMETMKTAFRYFSENEHYRRISLWAYLEGRDDFAENEMHITKKMMEMTRSAQEMGLLRDDMDPAFFSVIIKGTVDYWIRFRHLFAESLGRKADDNFDKSFFEQLMMIIAKK